MSELPLPLPPTSSVGSGKLKLPKIIEGHVADQALTRDATE